MRFSGCPAGPWPPSAGRVPRAPMTCRKHAAPPAWGHDALARSHHRLTASRRAILAVLAGRDSHLTPAQIMREARKLHAAINAASVYRNLALFTRLGLVRPLFIGHAQPQYIRNDQPHHHAVCLHCHAILDFEDCVAAELEDAMQERYGFRSSSHLLEIYGLCQACQDAPAK